MVRKLIALGVFIALSVAYSGASSYFLLDLYILDCAALFAIAGLAAFIARKGFYLPVVIAELTLWVGILYVLYAIAASAGEVSVLSIVRLNLPNIGVSLMLAVLGVYVGQQVAARYRHSQPVG